MDDSLTHMLTSREMERKIDAQDLEILKLRQQLREMEEKEKRARVRYNELLATISDETRLDITAPMHMEDVYNSRSEHLGVRFSVFVPGLPDFALNWQKNRPVRLLVLKEEVKS